MIEIWEGSGVFVQVTTKMASTLETAGVAVILQWLMEDVKGRNMDDIVDNMNYKGGTTSRNLSSLS